MAETNKIFCNVCKQRYVQAEVWWKYLRDNKYPVLWKPSYVCTKCREKLAREIVHDCPFCKDAPLDERTFGHECLNCNVFFYHNEPGG